MVKTAIKFFLPFVATLFLITVAKAETLLQALSYAYSNSLELNAARANTRIADENVPQALSGYRPKINAEGSVTHIWNNTEFSGGHRESTAGNARAELTISQDIFKGFQTVNSVGKAEAGVLASRASLRNVEQEVLYNSAQAFMNVVRDQALLELRGKNVSFLTQQAKATRDRLEVGENTRTDVAQADARTSLSVSQLNLAQAILNSSKATYQRIIGKQPGNLTVGFTPEGLVPNDIETALSYAMAEHPSIIAATYSKDIASFETKIAEGELLPTVSVIGTVGSTFHLYGSGTDSRTDSASITGRVTVPIYQGGRVSALVRQEKERETYEQIQLDIARQRVRAAVVSAWGQLTASRALIIAANAQKDASFAALSGVAEEQKVGQRTTLDVLNAQNELLDAQVSVVSAQRDQVVAAFALAQAVGNLSAQRLGLGAQTYHPEEHYEQVRDKWFGLRTPDGR